MRSDPLAELTNDVTEDWRHRALCAQTDPEAFFPAKGESGDEAKRICADCGVRQQCLNYALAHRIRYGIWGGFSFEQRRRLHPSPARRCWRRTAARDAEIARRTAAGESATQIAHALGITPRTVQRARSRARTRHTTA